jgi:choline kinase
MKAIILAAGRSRRLLPLTKNKPKCLLEMGGLTLIDRLVLALKDNNINEVTVVVGFQAKLLKQHLTDKYKDISWNFVENREYRNTHPAYSLWLARNYLKDSTIYFNADVLFDKEILKNIIKSPYSSITAIKKTKWDQEEVNIVTNNNSQIVEIGKHITLNKSSGEFIGITKFGPNFIDHLLKSLNILIKNGQKNKFAADAINHAIQNGGTLYALDIGDLVAHEIDTVEDYKFAKTLEL